MEWAYSDIVKDHFMNPRNVFDKDENFAYNGKGTVGNIKCGDQMVMYIKVDAASDTIADLRWQTYGCASAIASTSLLSTAVKGMTLEEAFNVSPKDIAAKLGGLPDNKIHCSVLGDKALRSAINDFLKNNGQETRVIEEKAKVICQCMTVTDHDIEEAVLEGARTYEQIQEHTKAGTVCGQCKHEVTVVMDAMITKHFSK